MPPPLFLVLAVVALCTLPTDARAQNAQDGTAAAGVESGFAWYRAGTDSVRVHYTFPRVPGRRPAVLVLCDRFGMRTAMDNVLNVMAGLGFRAYAVPLRSAPGQAVEGAPSVSLDSTDIDIVSQVAVDIRNDPRGVGTLGLLAFDIGAAVGASAAARFPLFNACALVSPAPVEAVIPDILRIEAPVHVIVGQYDPEQTLRAAEQLRDELTDKRRKVRVTVIRGAGMFFYNREHAGFDKPSYNAALVEATRLLRSAL
ncbi:MAG: dienelactone hydrolase family protein [Bacteroidota bacterium]|nr:dienelactone hydrolase family protein [Bacteroidota bacterium]